MNTIKSTWLGWGVLCVAGGGAYYFAKKSINADRAARHEAESKKQARLRLLEQYSTPSASGQTYAKPKKVKKNPDADGVGARVKGLDHAGDPSSEASEDVAAVGHSPETMDQKIRERSKYEAAEPYRSKKGDRFS